MPAGTALFRLFLRWHFFKVSEPSYWALFSSSEYSSLGLPLITNSALELMLLKTSRIYSKGLLLLVEDLLLLVILNGDSPISTRVIDGVVQLVAPTTAEQRLARKNELKAHGTLLMALPDKHQLKFNIHKDAKTLMEAIEKRFGGNKETKKRNKTNLEDQSLDYLFNSFKIYEAEVKSSSSTSPTTQNIAFVSSQNTDSTNESVSAIASVSAASSKVPVFALPNVDTLSNAMVMLTMRARRFLQRTGRNLGANKPTSLGFDVSKVECYYCHMKGYFTREYMSPKDTRRNVPVETQRRNAEEEANNYALMAFTSSSSSSSDNEHALKVKGVIDSGCSRHIIGNMSYLTDFEQINDGYVTFGGNPKGGKITSKGKIRTVKLDFDDVYFIRELKFNLFCISQTCDKKNSVLFTDTECIVLSPNFKLPDKIQVLLRVLGENNMYNVDLKNIVPSRDLTFIFAKATLDESNLWHRRLGHINFKTMDKLVNGTFMPSKLDRVFHDASTVNETVPTAFNVELSPTKPDKDLSQSNRPTAPIIEDWVSDSEDEYESDHLRKDFPKSKGPRNSRNKKACFVCKSLTHLIKDLLTRSKLVPLTAARPVTSVVPHNNVIRLRPAKTIGTKPYLPPRRTINHRPSPLASNFPQKVNIVKAPKVNVVRGVQGNWVWKPKCPILDHVSRHTSASITIKKFDYTDARGISKSVMVWVPKRH
nr:ribonuclease H-like domain-containing protein [Tanacetum cinerariifolium]